MRRPPEEDGVCYAYETMLTLYYRPICPYSNRVLDESHRLGISLNIKDVADAETANTLEKLGGKRQTPYLVDDERKVQMYESTDIIKYLDSHYGKRPVS